MTREELIARLNYIASPEYKRSPEKRVRDITFAALGRPEPKDYPEPNSYYHALAEWRKKHNVRIDSFGLEYLA